MVPEVALAEFGEHVQILQPRLIPQTEVSRVLGLDDLLHRVEHGVAKRCSNFGHASSRECRAVMSHRRVVSAMPAFTQMTTGAWSSARPANWHNMLWQDFSWILPEGLTDSRGGSGAEGLLSPAHGGDFTGKRRGDVAPVRRGRCELCRRCRKVPGSRRHGCASRSWCR